MNTDPNQIKSKNLFWEYDPQQKALYNCGDPSCKYWNERWLAIPKEKERRNKVERADLEGKPMPNYWRLFGGRIGSSGGEFPTVFARHILRNMGYKVWGSEPRLRNPATGEPEGYSLLSFSGKRAECPTYERMVSMFGDERLKKLIAEADKRKLRLFRTRAGGDPDLFVFNSDEKFFVEVKDEHDKLSTRQILCFWLIEEHLECEVKICHIAPAKVARAAVYGHR
jgi:hypothetical protein